MRRFHCVNAPCSLHFYVFKQRWSSAAARCDAIIAEYNFKKKIKTFSCLEKPWPFAAARCVTRVSRGRHEGVTRVSRGCHEGVTGSARGRRTGGTAAPPPDPDGRRSEFPVDFTGKSAVLQGGSSFTGEPDPLRKQDADTRTGRKRAADFLLPNGRRRRRRTGL